MNVIKFPSAIFSVDDATAVDQQVLAAAAAGAEARGSTLEGGAPEPLAAAAAGVEPGGNSATPESDDSSSEGDDEPDPAPVSTGFKLNLGKVAANQVDDAKPVAKPHTPREEVVQGLLAAQSGGSIGGEGSEVESSSEEEDLGPPPGPTGFKLNLGKVAVNQVDDAKPVAVPHTPKGEVVQGLLAQQGSSGAASALPEDGGARGVSEGEESSEGDDEEPPPASTGFKIDLSRVGKSVVDGAKPVAVPHTPKGDVVQGILAKQRSIGAAVGTARPHVKRAASVATVRPGRSHRLPRGSWAIGSCRYDLASAHPPGTWLGAGQYGVAAQAAEQGQWWWQRRLSGRQQQRGRGGAAIRAHGLQAQPGQGGG